MLNKEGKAAAINIAMMLKESGYPSLEMDYMFGKTVDMDLTERNELLTFLRDNSRCTFRLYCEIMKQLPSVSNEPVISYKL